MAWQGAARWGSQLLSFGIYTGLARLLSPKIFGLVAIAWVYVAFVQVFVRQGFGDAIIQRRELEPEHLDSAFWIAMATASFLCLLSYLLAGPIAHLFREPAVAPVIGWLSLFFPLGALGAIPTAILTRELDFRPLALSSLVATGLGGAVGLTMAFYGWGVWSLVGQQLVNATLMCVYLWLAVPWRPGWRISKRHLRDLYGFSLSITANDILWFFAQKSDQTLVGYGFGSAGLGPYSLASRVSTLLHDGIVGPFQSVAFPAFSKLQSEPLKLERALHKFCEFSSFVSLPVFAGTIVVAPQLVPCLFGDKWSAAVPILQVLAVYGALRVLLGFSHPLLLAKSRPGFYLVVQVVLSCLTFAGCLVAVRWTPVAIALSLSVSMLLFTVIFLPIAGRVLEIRIWPLLKTFMFPGLSSLFMLGVLSVLRGFLGRTFAPAATVLVSVAAGVAVYVAAALLVRPDLVKTIWEMLANSLLRSKSSHHEYAPSARGQYGADATAESSEP